MNASESDPTITAPTKAAPTKAGSGAADGHSQQRLKKLLLSLLIASVIFGAVVGVLLVLLNQWGWFEVRVMLTTLTIGCASIAGLACDLARLPKAANVLPRLGLTLTCVTAALVLLGIWGEIQGEFYWKSVLVTGSLAVATIHVGLLSIARLSGRLRWVYFVACQFVYGLAILFSMGIVMEVRSEPFWRWIAAHSIIVAAITLVIPMLHRIVKRKGSSEGALSPLEARNLEAIDVKISQLECQLEDLKRLRDRLVNQPTQQSDRGESPCVARSSIRG